MGATSVAPSSRASKSSRYSNVRPKVNSGASATARQRWWEDLSQYSRPKPDEKFKRISAKILGNILENGLSEVLVLDTRESDDFETAHIEGAVIYPARRFTHAAAPFTRELLEFKNREPQRIVVLYCDDERVSGPAGDLLFEKGWDNVYVLTGGLNRFRDVCPHLVSCVPGRGDLAYPDSPSRGPSSASPARASASTRQRDLFAAHLAPLPEDVAEPLVTETRAQFVDPTLRRPGHPDGGRTAARRSPGGMSGFGASQGYSPHRDAHGMDVGYAGVPDAEEGPLSPPSPGMVREVVERRAAATGVRGGQSARLGRDDVASVAMTDDSMAVRTGAMRGTRAALLFKQEQERLKKLAGQGTARWQPTGR